MNERVVLVEFDSIDNAVACKAPVTSSATCASSKALPDRASPIGKRMALVGGRDLTLRFEENFDEGLEE